MWFISKVTLSAFLQYNTILGNLRSKLVNPTGKVDANKKEVYVRLKYSQVFYLFLSIIVPRNLH